MAGLPAIDFDQGAEAVAEILADNDLSASIALNAVLSQKTALNTFLDLIDMEMRGAQIAAAWSWCNEDLDAFVLHCARRTPEMVVAVNAQCAPLGVGAVAREHGEQRRVPGTDFAVQAALAAQQVSEVTGRMDDGAEAVHNLFLEFIKTMQATKVFTVNMTVNLGLETGHSAVFAISLVEIRDKEGKPYHNQPQDEDRRVAAAQPVEADFGQLEARVLDEDPPYLGEPEEFHTPETVKDEDAATDGGDPAA